MTRQSNTERKQQRVKRAVVAGIVLIIAVTAGILLWMYHIRQLRNEMESHIEDTVINIESGMYDPAMVNAGEALVLAERLRDDEAIYDIEAYIQLIQTVVRGNELFDYDNYQEALEVYLLAIDYAMDINDLDTNLIEEKIILTEMYLTFYSLIKQAESFASNSLFEEAISVYEYAIPIAAAIPFAEGISLAESGIEEMRERIILAKRKTASDLFVKGTQFYHFELYAEALEYFYDALEIYLELDDQEDIISVKAMIDSSELKLAESEHPESPVTDDGQEDSGDAGDTADQNVHLSNYEHNLSIYFDLKTLIDNQNRYPANQIRMGSTDGMNEGWYNGCGWVATYNALILLGEPKHPAEIVRYFEENDGTVLDGVYGTFPNAIEDYLKSLGYSVNHTLLPQLTTNIDDTIKTSRVGILAYLHTNAAHYIAIEYREDIDRFIVYNDNSARARSASLGFQNDSDEGAAIDSVSAFINRTSNILFSFSLITVT